MPDEPELAITEHVGDGAIELVLSGELDIASARQLVEVVERRQPLPARIVIDLGKVTFIDSAGLRGLLTVRDRALANSGSVPCLRAVREEQLELLELCGLLEAFEFAPSLD